MGATLSKLCCCCLGERSRERPKPLLLAPSLAPSRDSSPTATEPFFSAHSSPERPPPPLRPLAPGAAAPGSALTIASTSPLAVIFPGFLNPGECTALITLAQPHLRPSKVCGAGVCARRQSASMFFTAPWAAHFPEVAAFEARAVEAANSAAAALGRGPLAPVEATQMVRYSAGQFYAQHHDNNAESGSTRLQRAATLIVYLSDVEAGGETAFPLGRAAAGAAAAGAVAPWGAGAGGGGFGVRPRAGQALLFWSALPTRAGGGADPSAVHAAEKVAAGEKWIATRWFAEEEEECESGSEDNSWGLGCCGGAIE